MARKYAWCGALAALALICVWLRRPLMSLLGAILTGALLACLLTPLFGRLTKRLNRPLAAGACLMALLAVFAGALLLLAPPLIEQSAQLAASLPRALAALSSRLEALNAFLEHKGIAPLSLPAFDAERALASLRPLLGGATSGFAGAALAVALAYYFLRDGDRLLLYLELLPPRRYRALALRMAASIRVDLGTYLRAQALAALIVGALSALALLMVGVRGYLPLGLIAGALNVIPYIGPLLGALPAVLAAFAQGPERALLAALSMLVVQQLDGYIVTPRVMSGATGLHPAVVLLAVTFGGSAFGLAGMLFATPAALAARAISREWTRRAEIEEERRKRPY